MELKVAAYSLCPFFPLCYIHDELSFMKHDVNA